MLGSFILAVKVTGILFTIFIVLCVYACYAIGGRSDRD